MTAGQSLKRLANWCLGIPQDHAGFRKSQNPGNHLRNGIQNPDDGMGGPGGGFLRDSDSDLWVGRYAFILVAKLIYSEIAEWFTYIAALQLSNRGQ